MDIKRGNKFICINPDVLSGYYDSTYNCEALTVSDTKVPKVRNISGGSNYFAIFNVDGALTKTGNDLRFSVSLDTITKKNFIRIK